MPSSFPPMSLCFVFYCFLFYLTLHYIVLAFKIVNFGFWGRTTLEWDCVRYSVEPLGALVRTSFLLICDVHFVRGPNAASTRLCRRRDPRGQQILRASLQCHITKPALIINTVSTNTEGVFFRIYSKARQSKWLQITVLDAYSNFDAIIVRVSQCFRFPIKY